MALGTEAAQPDPAMAVRPTPDISPMREQCTQTAGTGRLGASCAVCVHCWPAGGVPSAAFRPSVREARVAGPRWERRGGQSNGRALASHVIL